MTLKIIDGVEYNYIEGTNNVDLLNGNPNSDDYLDGKNGDDTLIDFSGNDYLNGELGDDYMADGVGDDTYYLGDYNNHDTISDEGGTADKIMFEASVAKSTVAIYQDSNDDLWINYGDVSADDVKIVDQSTNTIERIELNDGSYLTSSAINTLISDLETYATNNSITLDSVSDVKNNTDLMDIVVAAWN